MSTNDYGHQSDKTKYQQLRERVRDDTVLAHMAAVVEVIDTVKITFCDGEDEEHEVETLPASVGVLALIQDAEEAVATRFIDAMLMHAGLEEYLVFKIARAARYPVPNDYPGAEALIRRVNDPHVATDELHRSLAAALASRLFPAVSA